MSTQLPESMGHAKRLGGRVWQLGGSIRLNNQVSWCPPGTDRGQPLSCYLIKGSSGSVLVDSGIRQHEAQIVEQLNELLEPDEPVAIALTRTEMECCLNIPALEEMFSIESVWYTGGITVPRARAATHRITVDPGTARHEEVLPGVTLEFISPLFRLLPTFWLYDGESRVLLTSDAFSYVYEGGADPLEGLTKFRWLESTDTTGIATDLLGTITSRDVDAIGPGYGSPIIGRDNCVLEAQRLAAAIQSVGIV